MTVFDLRYHFKPVPLEEKDMDNKDKVIRYVKDSQSYMTFLEGMVTGLQSRLSKEENNG